MSTHIFGIRHHGPGSARHLLQALETIKPDIILLEGPPEAEAILSWATAEGMEPPVAILAYVPDNPHRAVFYPFTHYSPEWQALLYAQTHHIPIRMMDMPLQHKLALYAAADDKSDTAASLALPTQNPIGYLAQLAGYEDEEEWWEQHFELSHDEPLVLFDSVKEAIKALREELPEHDRLIDLQREVFMRRAIRQAESEMFDTVAVVCGAWHGPALEQRFTQKQEKELLRDLPKTKVECCWIPWTNDRLMVENGYGAGIESPGWYEHQWFNPDDDGSLWLTRSAQVFRAERMDISPAHVIESVRLAQSLTAIRRLNRSGLKEYTEAIQTVMCMGDAAPLSLLKKELIVGNRLGAIPSEAPQSPLQLDFEKQLKALRLKITEGAVMLNLDLRKPLDLQKSILLHRLEVLDVDWGQKEEVSTKGTFKEQWSLYWKPDMLIELIAKSSMGNTIEVAANAWLQEKVDQTTELRKVSEWLQLAIPAELDAATESLLNRMDKLAASASDVEALIGSLFPLSEIMKYGNVRRTDQNRVNAIFSTIFYRTLVGLPMGCTGINDDQASRLARQLQHLHKIMLVLDEATFLSDWFDTLSRIAHHRGTAPYVSGSVHKLCYESKVMLPEETAQAFSRALSVGTEPADGARWLEGFLHDAATILLLDDGIRTMVFEWVKHLETDTFTSLLPLLRRTFGEYSRPEKDKIAQKVKQGSLGCQGNDLTALPSGMDESRAAALIPVIKTLLGL